MKSRVAVGVHVRAAQDRAQLLRGVARLRRPCRRRTRHAVPRRQLRPRPVVVRRRLVQRVAHVRHPHLYRLDPPPLRHRPRPLQRHPRPDNVRDAADAAPRPRQDRRGLGDQRRHLGAAAHRLEQRHRRPTLAVRRRVGAVPADRRPRLRRLQRVRLFLHPASDHDRGLHPDLPGDARPPASPRQRRHVLPALHHVDGGDDRSRSGARREWQRRGGGGARGANDRRCRSGRDLPGGRKRHGRDARDGGGTTAQCRAAGSVGDGGTQSGRRIVPPGPVPGVVVGPRFEAAAAKATATQQRSGGEGRRGCERGGREPRGSRVHGGEAAHLAVEGATRGAHDGHHHGRVRRLLAAVLPHVRHISVLPLLDRFSRLGSVPTPVFVLPLLRDGDGLPGRERDRLARLRQLDAQSHHLHGL